MSDYNGIAMVWTKTMYNIVKKNLTYNEENKVWIQKFPDYKF